MTPRSALLLGWSGLLVLGCGARTTVGEAEGPIASTIGAGGSGMCNPRVDPDSAPPGDDAAVPAGIAGTWIGYFQGTPLAVGADAITLTIDPAADPSDQIHLVLGVRPVPPLAGASDEYPPGQIELQSQYIEGFSYPAHDVRWTGPRLQFQLAGFEAWDGWCQLQQSYSVTWAGVQSFNCIPGTGVIFTPTGDGGLECHAYLDSATKTPLVCDQVEMCHRGFCQCDRCGCSAAAGPRAAFDITFEGDLATGTGVNGHLRMMRVVS